MRIQSRFSDYYDWMTSLDQEKAPLYIRDAKVDHAHWGLDKLWNLRPGGHGWTPYSQELDLIEVHVGLLFFCDELHPFIKVVTRSKRKAKPFIIGYNRYYDEQAKHFYDFETAVTYIRAQVVKDQRVSTKVGAQWLRRHLSSKATGWSGLINFSPKGWELWLHQLETKGFDPKSLVDQKIPIFSYCNRYGTANPSLTDMQFQQVLGAQQLWQRLDQWLSDQDPDLVDNRSQELIRDSKGFDNNSFKQIAPGEKKYRRRQNRRRKHDRS